MNWYKKAQLNTGFGDVVQKAEPISINQNGENVYKCHMCQKGVTDSEIAEWVEFEENQKEYKYPIHNLDIDVINQQIQQILDVVRPYVEKYNQDKADLEAKRKSILQSEEYKAGKIQYPYWTKSHYVVKIPELQSIISDPGFKQFAELQILRPYNWDRSNFFRSLYNKTFDGDVLERFGALIDSPYGLFDSDIEHQSNFSTQVSAPVCDECIEDVDKCGWCEKHIFEGQRSYPFCWDDNLLACDECADSGIVSVCSNCGCADYSDSENMHYVEDAGSYCDDCFQELTKDYDSHYADKIEYEAGDNPYPFSHWFDAGDRIYLPFTPDLEAQDSDNELIDFVKEIEVNGEWCGTDKSEYQLGYATCGRRRFRLGKLLGRWYKKEMQRIDKDSKGSEGEMEKAEIKQRYNYYKSVLDDSEFRKMKDTSNLSIVISQDPHDMAKMSTNRRWTSCMDLQKNRQHDVFCEVASGGLIAYLIDSSDKKVENPHARILIRRFSNKEGDSVAIPEESVYGNSVRGFEEMVSDWIDSKQSNIKAGDYERGGMIPSDTFSRQRAFAKMLRELLVKMALKDKKYQMIKKGNKIKNWYKKAQLNTGMSPEVTKLASNISNMLMEADKGVIVTDAAIHNIVSTIPSGPILEQAIMFALQLASKVNGIVDMTAAREDVIRRINDTFMSVGKQQQDMTEVDNGMAQENIDGNSEVAQI